MKALLLLPMLALGAGALPAAAGEKTPQGHSKKVPARDQLEGFDPEQQKCLTKCQEPMVKCVRRCGQNASCMQGCSTELGRCINGCNPKPPSRKG